ncbi:cysteine desulfurase selenocysteine lyase [Scheffersomyces xylosifermentans]|uniref:cysteine desulfurase selenocysteine lyase n=1 Tax=Scheffersomyces xylosifermentans TaxID=1304137 RepID=UPI00315C74C7
MPPAVPFGKQFREKYFQELDPKYPAVNHGSNGLTPTPVFQKYVEVMKRDFRNPDYFRRIEQPLLYVETLKELGKFLKSDYRNLAIVDSASTGVNTILRSYPFEQGSKIVAPNTLFEACANTLKFLRNRYNVEIIPILLEYPLSDAEIAAKYAEVFEREHPTLAIFDTVSSLPGVRFPFEKITELCKKYEVLSLIDGAHSAGLLPVNLDELQPDFYTSNLHKWMYVPCNCAVLYVKEKHHRKIHTLPIGSTYLDDNTEVSEEDENKWFVNRFSDYSTRNFASPAVIRDAIKFRKEICGGEEAIFDYCHNLAVKAGEIISEKWGTSVLENKAKTLTSTMVNVELPIHKFGIQLNTIITSLSKICNKSLENHGAFVPLFAHNGKLYGRFSAQVYNELSDYEKASDDLLSALESYFEDMLIDSTMKTSI